MTDFVGVPEDADLTGYPEHGYEETKARTLAMADAIAAKRDEISAQVSLEAFSGGLVRKQPGPPYPLGSAELRAHIHDMVEWSQLTPMDRIQRGAFDHFVSHLSLGPYGLVKCESCGGDIEGVSDTDISGRSARGYWLCPTCAGKR